MTEAHERLLQCILHELYTVNSQLERLIDVAGNQQGRVAGAPQASIDALHRQQEEMRGQEEDGGAAAGGAPEGPGPSAEA